MYKYVMRYTDDNSTTITGLVGRLTGMADSRVPVDLI